MKLIRSFIAINLSPDIKEKIDQVINQMKSDNTSFVRWVPSNNIHITLKFLGEIPQSQLNEVSKIFISDDFPEIGHFDLIFKGIGAFPNIRRPKVIWVGVKTPEALLTLQKHIEEKCENLGIAREIRDFSPHLTLGRLKRDASTGEMSQITTLINGFQHILLGQMQVNTINLYQSKLSRTGAIYTCLAEKKL